VALNLSEAGATGPEFILSSLYCAFRVIVYRKFSVYKMSAEFISGKVIIMLTMSASCAQCFIMGRLIIA